MAAARLGGMQADQGAMNPWARATLKKKTLLYIFNSILEAILAGFLHSCREFNPCDAWASQHSRVCLLGLWLLGFQL
jgi:hypothetical protein